VIRLTTPPTSRWYRRRPARIGGLILIAVLLVAAAVGSTLAFSGGNNAKTTASSSSASSSASPSATPSAATAAIPAACNQVTALPKYDLSYTFPGPANTKAGFDYLPAVQQAGLNTPVYTGAYVSVSDMVRWVKAVQCLGMTAYIDPDPMFVQLGNAGAQSYLQTVAANHTVKAFVVMADEVGNSSAATVNARVKAIRAAGTHLPVIVVTDKFDSTLSGNLSQTRPYLATNNVTGYFPFTGSASYGGEDQLPMVAQTEHAINGAHAISAVQAIWWWKCDPQTTATFGFANVGPGPKDVVRMMHEQLGIGQHSFMIVDLEAVRGGPKGTVDDISGHVVPIITRVRATFGWMGH
jgi:hypothetical protein